ncbi:restriction endonuclease subunit S [Fenollaria massiliensis]|uniref:Restriction endonuclease subunit S n=1 Tax=Fenollaria massiliensis TaxID=938288 RepID=A0A9E7DJH6_9FIRM|nr:restriction endonuclease subunit S [Fenollaria massiliensis]UQK58984.1 restriction endonuclease subunit S [Fenollaria massiliensis]
MPREMKETGIEWIGEVPKDWEIVPGKYLFKNTKIVVGALERQFERLALTMNGVIKRSKTNSDGLQPADFSSYQILDVDQLVFKLIDLQNISTSRVGISPYRGIVSPAYIILKKLNNNTKSKFYYYWYMSMYYNRVFNLLGDAGVRSNINSTELLDLKAPKPPLEEQKKIADLLDKKCQEIEEIKETIESEIKTLDEYKKSIITEAVTKGLDKNVEMKDSGIDYINDYPAHWKIKRIKYLISERNARTKDGKGELLSVSQYRGVIPSSTNKMRVAQAKTLIGYKLVKKGDLVFNKLNPELARFGVSIYDGITSPDYAVYIVNKELVLEKFLELILRTDRYSVEYGRVSLGVGEGFKRLYTDQLGRFNIACPSIDEQRVIIAYLNTETKLIDESIATKQKQLETLEEYKKSLIYEYVTGKKEA